MNHKLALILALALGSTAADLSFDRFLDRSSKAAERETAFLASVACTETVVETKIGIKNKPESQSRRVFDYFVLVDTAGVDIAVPPGAHEDRPPAASGLGYRATVQRARFSTWSANRSPSGLKPLVPKPSNPKR